MRDRRSQIIESATGLINRRGYQQTSVEDVIKDAGLCGKAHFYHYFKSKEELGHAVLNRQFEMFAERGLAILRDPILDPLERLFFYLPLEHAESLEAQDAAVAALERLTAEAPEQVREFCAYAAGFARKHRDIIAKFGRFPHRNAVLERQSTAAELEWLATESERFGQ